MHTLVYRLQRSEWSRWPECAPLWKKLQRGLPVWAVAQSIWLMTMSERWRYIHRQPLLLLTSVPSIIVCICVGNINSSSGDRALIGFIQRCHNATQRIDIYLASCESCSTCVGLQFLTIQTQIYTNLSQLDKPLGCDHPDDSLDVSTLRRDLYSPNLVTSLCSAPMAWAITRRIYDSQTFLCSVSNSCMQYTPNHS